MPQKIRWTEAADALLVRLRHQEGASWDRIAGALGVSRNAALERGRRLHVLLPERAAPAAARDERDRPALPPGHPASWGALIAGTVLEGTPYPWPIPGVPPLPARAAGAAGAANPARAAA